MNFKITKSQLLIFTCCFYTLFSLLLIQPVNQKYPKYQSSTYGKQHRYVTRVWNMGFQDAQKDFFEVKDHYLFHDRNPGLFKFITEIAARLGATSPLPLQLVIILIVNLGIIAQYKWLSEFFKNDIFPVIGCLFLLGTHWLMYYGANVHQHPYNFAFFSFCMLAVTRYNHTQHYKYLVYAFLSFLFLCQNYYMAWVSTYVMMVGTLYVGGQKLISWKNFILGLPTVITVIFLLWNVAYVHNGLDNGLKAIKQIAEVRMYGKVDKEMAEKQPEMKLKDWIKYPVTVASRVERFFYIPGFLFILLAWITNRLRRANNSKLSYKYFYWIAPAALSWYMLMFQHVDVHQEVGHYSYFLWMIMFGYFFYELLDYMKKNDKYSWKYFVKYTWPLLLVYGGYGFLYFNVFHLLLNIKNVIWS